MSKSKAVIVAIIASLGLGACGGAARSAGSGAGSPIVREASRIQGDAAQVRQLDAAFRAAYQQHDLAKLCTLVSAASRPSCPATMQLAMSAVPSLPALTGVSVHGTTAVVHYSDNQSSPAVKEGGRWLFVITQ